MPVKRVWGRMGRPRRGLARPEGFGTVETAAAGWMRQIGVICSARAQRGAGMADTRGGWSLGRVGQVSAAGTRCGVSDGLDHGAQATPRAERGPVTSAVRVAGSGRDLHRRPRRPDKSRSQPGQPRQEPGRRCRRKGAGAEEPERKALGTPSSASTGSLPAMHASPYCQPRRGPKWEPS